MIKVQPEKNAVFTVQLPGPMLYKLKRIAMAENFGKQGQTGRLVLNMIAARIAEFEREHGTIAVQAMQAVQQVQKKASLVA